MDNPAAGAMGAVKKVPKWAWIAGGGVAGGILWYRRSHASDDSAPSDDATAAGDYGQTYSPLGTVTSAPSTTSDYSGVTPTPGGYDLSQIDALLGTVGGIYHDAHQNDPPPIGPVDLLNSILPYVGGGAPSSGAAAAAPAPPPAAPTPPPPPPVAPPKPQCSGEFPFADSGGSCYKVVCASGKGDHAKGRWHFHKSGREVRVASTC